MGKKRARAQKPLGERILNRADIKKGWVRTGKLIGDLDCQPRAARRVLRGLVKARKLKSVKVQRDRFFAAPGVKAAPPKAEGSSKGNGRTRTRSRKAASKARGKKSSGKAKRRRAAISTPARKPSVKKPSATKRRSGTGGTPVSVPDSAAEIKQAAEVQSAQDQQSLTQLLG